MNCEEAQELITALIDNELSDSERSSTESHLKECVRCQFAYEQELALKREIQGAGACVSAPPGLRKKIVSDLGIVSQKDEASKRWKWLAWPAKLTLRPAFVLALLLLLILPTVYLMQSRSYSIPLMALEKHQEIVEGILPFQREENPEKIKEQLFLSVEGQFAPMVYDVSAMGLHAVGGTVQEIGGRKVLVTIYEGATASITCYTFLGSDEDVPAEARAYFDAEEKINLYTFSRGGVNGVMHREGKVICILVSKLPMPELLALARSKA